MENSESKSTCSAMILKNKPQINKNQLLEEILYRLKNMQDRQESLEDNLTKMSSVLVQRTKICKNQMNLIGLLGLASMHDMQLPIHQMGIISAFSEDCTEETLKEYSNVLINGMKNAISMSDGNLKKIAKDPIV